MPSHNDTQHSRAQSINILSARLGATRKLLSGNLTLDLDGPAAHFYDANGSDRTLTLPPFISGGGTIYFIANVGAADDLIIESAAATTVVTLEPDQATFIVASEAEWMPIASASAVLSVFGASGPGHSTGLVPDPGAVAGITRYLREDAQWSVPAGMGGSFDGYAFITDGTNTAAGTGSDTFKLRSSDSSVTITVTNDDVTHGDVANFTVNEASVDHDALLNFVANEHIDHTAVSISTAANSGLAGGGTIAASRSLTLDINNLTADTPVLADSFAFLDAGGGDTNKATLTTLNGILDHNALLNFVANKHIDHTTVSVQAGVGLSGGGDISATRTLNLNITGLTADTIAVGDELPFYDISGTDHNKITFANFNAALDHNTLTNYVANQHIDHTSVSVSAGGGLTGGGTIAANRTLALDITGQDSAAAATGDEIIYWDISGSDFDKRSFASLITDLSILTTANGQPLDSTLTALAAYNTNGLLTQTAADTFTGRTITGTANQIDVANGSGVGGNPTLSFPADVLIPTVLTIPNTGLHLLDTNASHDVIVKPGSNITADRTFTLTFGDTDMILNLTAVTDEFILAYDTATNTWRGVTPPSSVTPAALTKVDDTNVTLTLGGTPATALLQASSLTLGWTGQLSLARGGTGANLSDPNIDRVMGWDDSAGAVKFMALADINTEATPASGDFVLMYDAAGNFLKVDWANLPGAGSGIPTIGSSTDNAVVRWNGAGGNAVQDSQATISDVGELRTTVLANNTGVSVFGDQFVNPAFFAIQIKTGAAQTDCPQSVLQRATGTLAAIGYVLNADLLGSYGFLGGGACQAYMGAYASQNESATDGGTGFYFTVNENSGGGFRIPLHMANNSFVSISNNNVLSTPDRQLHVEQDNAATNTVTPLLRLTSTSTGTPANGIGESIEFETETAAGNNEVGAIIEAVATDVTSTSEDFDFVFKLMAAGAAAAEVARFVGTGGILPGTTDVGALGSTGKQWADLYLAEGGVINWDSGDVTLTQSGNTLTVAGGVLTATTAEAVSTLTDGATPALDASLGNIFVLVAAGDRTIAVPTNVTSGQKIIIRHNASGGARTLALNTGAGGFRFGSDITALSQTVSGKTDYIGAIYNSTDSKWDVVAYSKGF